LTKPALPVVIIKNKDAALEKIDSKRIVYKIYICLLFFKEAK
jgi:hypothetical protein